MYGIARVGPLGRLFGAVLGHLVPSCAICLEFLLLLAPFLVHFAPLGPIFGTIFDQIWLEFSDSGVHFSMILGSLVVRCVSVFCLLNCRFVFVFCCLFVRGLVGLLADFSLLPSFLSFFVFLSFSPYFFHSFSLSSFLLFFLSLLPSFLASFLVLFFSSLGSSSLLSDVVFYCVSFCCCFLLLFFVGIAPPAPRTLLAWPGTISDQFWFHFCYIPGIILSLILGSFLVRSFFCFYFFAFPFFSLHPLYSGRRLLRSWALILPIYAPHGFLVVGCGY